MAGESLRKLATRLNPPIHHSTLSLYKSKYIAPAIRALRSNSPKVQAIKKMAVESGIKLDRGAMKAIQNVPSPTTPDTQGLTAELQGIIRKKLGKIEEWTDDAENEIVYDSEGNMVGKRMNHNALGLHTRNAMTAVKTIGELAGIFNTPTVSNVLQVVVSMPAPVASEPTDCITLDVLPER